MITLGNVILLFGGLIFGLNILYKWILSGTGSLDELRNAVIFVTLISIGIQIIFSTLMINIFLLDKKSGD